MHLEFKRLTQIKPADITALNNHPKVFPVYNTLRISAGWFC